MQDDSSHWYAIPADKRAEFELWEKTFGWGDHEYNYTGEDFEKYRVDGGPYRHTFIDLKEDK